MSGIEYIRAEIERMRIQVHRQRVRLANSNWQALQRRLPKRC